MKADAPVSRRKRRILRADLRRGPGWRAPVLPPQDPAVAAVLARIGYRGHQDLAAAIARIKHVCFATTRRGTPCMAMALANGRCRNHGGLSTGPKTAAGWERVRAGYAAWRERQKVRTE